MKCDRCGSENPVEVRSCQKCGNALAGTQQPSIPIPRFLPEEAAQRPAMYSICLSCGMPMPQGTIACGHCRRDIRQPYKPRSRFTLGGCLGTLLMRLLSFAVSSGVSYLVGLLSAALGLGAAAASLITGLVSTLLSLAPSVVKWLFGSLRRITAVVFLFLLLAGTFGVFIIPAKAQAYQPQEILQEFVSRMGMEVVNWEPNESLPGYGVYFRSSSEQLDFTNAAEVVYLQDTYGNTGGDVWAQDRVGNLDSECSSTQETFHDLTAYYVQCMYQDGLVEVYFWGMGPWGAATYDFVAQDQYHTAKDLAEMLYTVMVEMVGSSTPEEPAPGDPGSASAPGDGQPNLQSSGIGNLQVAQEVLLKLVESQGLELIDMGQESDNMVPGCIYVFVSARTYGSPLDSTNSARIYTCSTPGLVIQAVNKDRYNAGCFPEDIDFHEQKALYTNCGFGGPGLHWSSGIWGFTAQGMGEQEAGMPDYGGIHYLDFANALYGIADQYGMITAETSQPVPGGQTQTPGTTTVPGGLLPAALLPALAVTGLSLLLDLLRSGRTIPPGLVSSVLSGLDPVSPEAATIHKELLRRGYQYDPQTRSLRLLKVKSPVDGSLVSAAQAERERSLLSQGYVYDPVNGGFVTPEWQKQHEQRWGDFVEDVNASSAEKSAFIARQEAIRAKRERQKRLESDAELDMELSNTLEDEGGWTLDNLWETSQLTAREFITCRDVDGNFSWYGLAGQVVLGFGAQAAWGRATAIAVEVGMASADIAYSTRDRMHDNDESFGSALTTSVAWAVGMRAAFWWGGKQVAGSKLGQWVGGKIDSLYTKPTLPPRLACVKDAIFEAVGDGVNSRVNVDKVRALYNQGGSRNLAELQDLGLITREQADALTRTISSEVKGTSQRAIATTAEQFEQKYAVDVGEVLRGNSGSGSRPGMPRSPGRTDEDEALLLVLRDTPKTQAALDARVQHLMSSPQPDGSFMSREEALSTAQQELQAKLCRMHEDTVAKELNAGIENPNSALTLKDVDYKAYSGLAGDKKMADSYPAGFNRVRMSTQGEVSSTIRNSKGEFVTHQTSGQAMVDQEALTAVNLKGATGEAAQKVIASHQPKMSAKDAQGIIDQQVQAVGKTSDPYKVAKATTRVYKAKRVLAAHEALNNIYSGNPRPSSPQSPGISPDVLKQSCLLLEKPQGGVSQVPPDYVQKARDQILNLKNAISKK